MKKIYKSKYFLMLCGFFCGALNGLLGAGGGIIAVWSLSRAAGDRLCDERDVFANALCVTLPISAVSCMTYAAKGSLSIAGIGLYIIPAILGGAVGGLLLGRLKVESARRLFSVLVVISGVLLLIK